MTGWGAVQRAADRAMRDPRPDPVDPRLPCPSLRLEVDRAYEAFEDDPMSEGSDCGGLVVDNAYEKHRAAHRGCPGWGSDG